MKKTLDHKPPYPAVPAVGAVPAVPADAGYSRLHITPLDLQLLKIIVPTAVLPHARNISYHTIQTYPDRPYGFLDLPFADADKITKKLNGAVLRGTKIRIEPARPHNMPTADPDAVIGSADATKSKKSKSEKKDKKRKRNPQEIVGVELEEGRKVKRGWTVTPEEALAKKKKEKEEGKKRDKSKTKENLEKKDKKEKKRKDPESKYSGGPECLIKTRLPLNKLDVVDNKAGGDNKKSKKSKQRDVVVHEFEKNDKFSTFLRTAQPSTVDEVKSTSFVEGKGWVNEEGIVVEEVKSTRPTAIPKLTVNTKHASSQPKEDDDTSSSSGSSSEDESESSSSSMRQLRRAPQPSSPVKDNTANTDSDIEPDSVRPRSAGSVKPLSIQIPPATPTSASTRVHPLEALYKRQKQDKVIANNVSADSEPFTFLGGGDDANEDEDMVLTGQDLEGSPSIQGDGNDTNHLMPSQGSQMPMTPFTKQDFEWRNTRSAAPTPDTAHPSRVSRIWYQQGDEDDALDDVEEDKEEDDDNDGMAGQREGGAEDGDGSTNPSTDFQKWFWENRANLNRSWWERRKMSARDKRYRENRARMDRAI